MHLTPASALVITAGLVALAAIDLVGLAGLEQADFLLASIGTLPVLVLGAFALVPLTRSHR